MPILSRFLIVLGSLFAALSIISLIFLLNEPASKLTYSNTKYNDEYTEDVAKIFSLQDFKSEIKNEIKKRNLSGIEIPIVIDDYIRKKFYNSGGFVDWYDNWFLYVLNYIFPKFYINTSMTPDDIISKDYAMCSQVSILFQEIVKDYGFDYASVRFFLPNFKHFALSVKVDDRWYFFDSNLEPKYDRRDYESYNAVISFNKFFLENMYEQYVKVESNLFDGGSSDLVVMSEINTFPAPIGVFVQKISYLISWYGWIIFWLFGFYIYKKQMYK